MDRRFGLIGTITYDFITSESGVSSEGVGGVLYQAAVLCGLGKTVFLFANLGQELVPAVERIIRSWPALRREGIARVPGPGNQVHLFYPERGERIETLKSVVPPIVPGQVIESLPELDMLVLIINSGFDITLEDWRKIVVVADCPIWLDIHSLPLAKNLNTQREYLPLPEWKEWTSGARFLQANAMEVASMLGHPERAASEAELHLFGERALELGVEAVFITLGKEGVLVMTSRDSRTISPPVVEEVVDTTGCGDVFCGGTLRRLAEGSDAFESASFGLLLAAEATRIKGVEETFALARGYRDS